MARITPLDKKLMRDLWHIKGQAFAISAVVAVGIMLFVLLDGSVRSMEASKEAYYDRYRFADIFAPVKRAPNHILKDIAEIPGVGAVEGRINGGAIIDIAGHPAIRALALSLPTFNRPKLNDIYITAGRMIDATLEDEIILLQGFANAHLLEPGDKVKATMYGQQRTFLIAGLAQAPEFVFSAAPGEIIPDDKRFAVMWMSEDALEAAFDLDGAFNEALIRLSRGAIADGVIDQLDLVLGPYGGLGAFDRGDQISNRILREELDGRAASAATVPPIFLAVAAFLLVIVITRMIQAERGEIGLMMAFGYSHGEISAHYFKFIFIIAILGGIMGCASGVWLGGAMAEVDQEFYKLPFLVFKANIDTILKGLLISTLAASVGLFVALRQIASLTPAVAMSPPAPPDYSKSATGGEWLKRALDQPSRMVLRGLLRRPVRAGAACLAVGVAMGLSASMQNLMTGFNYLLDVNFTVVSRADATVIFLDALSDKTITELKRMDGVTRVEPFRNVSAKLRNGLYEYRGGVNGMIAEPALDRAVDGDLETIFIREDGLILSKPLAKILNIAPGDDLTVEVREGRRPILTLPVVALAESFLGSTAYFELGALNKALNEEGRVSGAHLRIDPAKSDDVNRRLKEMPAVAGVTLNSQARASFQSLMNQGAGAMRFIMAGVAIIITVGVVYNSARIAFAEREHDLASLRVIGFTRRETSFVLLGELAVITLLSLPIGATVGYFLSTLVSTAFSTEMYTIPSSIDPRSFGAAALYVVLAAVASGWMVQRDVNKLDLVSALKTRE